jgi:predicted small secreted protein
MKKIFVILAAAVLLTACNNGTSTPTVEGTSTDSTMVDSVAVDSVAVDTTVVAE